jgi:hypothetical protein
MKGNKDLVSEIFHMYHKLLSKLNALEKSGYFFCYNCVTEASLYCGYSAREKEWRNISALIFSLHQYRCSAFQSPANICIL